MKSVLLALKTHAVATALTAAVAVTATTTAVVMAADGGTPDTAVGTVERTAEVPGDTAPSAPPTETAPPTEPATAPAPAPAGPAVEAPAELATPAPAGAPGPAAKPAPRPAPDPAPAPQPDGVVAVPNGTTLYDVTQDQVDQYLEQNRPTPPGYVGGITG